MKWITQSKAKEEAAKGDIEAINCSIEHWEQLSTCTLSDLKKKVTRLSDASYLIGDNYCSLCMRFNVPNLDEDKCSYNCPIGKLGGMICGCCWESNKGDCWRDASKAFDLFIGDTTTTHDKAMKYTVDTFDNFQKTARKLKEMLEEVKISMKRENGQDSNKN